MKKAILFVRVSTEQQTLEQQLEELKRHAKQRGYNERQFIIIMNKESAIKLSLEERQGIQTLKSTIETNNDVNAVFIYEMSRLSRQATMMMQLRDYFIERQVQLYCMKPEFKLLGPDGQVEGTAAMLFTVYAGIVENEMKLAKSRMIRGKHFRQQNGYFGGGQVLYGYMCDDENKICVDETKRTFITQLFESAAAGKPVWALADQYVREGLLDGTQRSVFCKIRRILTNKAYSGRSEMHTAYPPIVSVQLQDEAISHTHTRFKAHTGSSYIALLQGIMFDTCNNRRFTQRKADNKYYVDHFNGVVHSISMSNIETIVKDYVREHMSSTQPQAILETKKIIHAQIQSTQRELNTVRKKYAGIEGRIERINEMYAMGSMTKKQYDSMLKQVNNDKRSMLLKQSELLMALTNLNRQIDNMHQQNVQYDKLTHKQWRELIVQNIKRIDCTHKGRGYYFIDMQFVDGYSKKFEYFCCSRKFTVTEI